MSERINVIITDRGDEANFFLKEELLILFNDTVPEDLKEYCFVINNNKLFSNIIKGDTLKINEKKYNIKEVGSAVNENFANLGHITIRYNEFDVPLEGSIYVDSPLLQNIEIGTQIIVKSSSF